jgi:hypothetical protein
MAIKSTLLAGPVMLLLATAAAAQTAATAPPIPPQQARIWFYRDVDLIHTQGRPYLRLNGAVVAISEPGGTLYRDVPPGHYHITVDSYGTDVNQDRDVDLLPGQQVFAKVVSNDNWLDYGGGGDMGGGGGYRRDTFYVWTMAPQTAIAEIAQTRYFGGNSLVAAAPPVR